MRVIRIELIALLHSNDDNLSLASEEMRAMLVREIASMDAEITEDVRQRASAYFPENYSVFVRTRLDSQELSTLTELWVVDPTVRWPAGLLSRSAWKLLSPMLAHVVEESYESRLQRVKVDIDPSRIKVISLIPTRGWRDPVLLSIAMVILTSIYWLFAHNWLMGLIGF